MTQLSNILKIKYLSFVRLIKSFPVIYIVFIFLFLISISLFIFKSNVEFKTTNITIVLLIYSYSYYSFLKHKGIKGVFLSQYPKIAWLSTFINVFLASLPLLLCKDVRFFIAIQLFLSVLILIDFLFLKEIQNLFKFRNIIPKSPFLRQSYMWHSYTRPYMWLIWTLLVITQVVAFMHNNYKLSIVSIFMLTLFSYFNTVVKYENIGFVKQYNSLKFFVQNNIVEVFINLFILVSIPYFLNFILFPYKWELTFISLFILYSLSYSIIWIKYVFWQEDFMTAMFMVLFVAIQLYLFYTNSLISILIAILLQLFLFVGFCYSVKKLIG